MQLKPHWPEIADAPRVNPLILPLLFLLTTFPIIIFLAFFRQPISVADEWSHLARAAQLADGTVFTDVAEPGSPPMGRIDPKFYAMVHIIHQRRNEPLATLMPDLQNIEWSEDRTLANYNSSVYFPAPYLISVAAIRYGHFMGLPIVRTFQIVSLWNGIASILTVALAIALSPRGKFLLFLIAALPMTLFSFASASPDGPLISSALLLFAFLARSMDQRTASHRVLSMAVVLAIVIAATKLPYLPLVAAVVIAIWLSAKDRRPSKLALALSLLVVIIVPVIWALASNAGTVDASWGKKVGDPPNQIKFLIANPQAIFVVARSTLELTGWTYLQQMVGYLGWVDAPISQTSQNLFLAMISILLILDVPAKRVASVRWAVAAGLFLSVGAVFLSLYVAYNPVGSLNGIEGVQGRYFLPVLAFLAFLVPSGAWTPWKSRSASAIVIVAVLVSHFEITRVIVNRYYL